MPAELPIGNQAHVGNDFRGVIKGVPFFGIREVEYTPLRRQLEHAYALGNPLPYTMVGGNVEIPAIRVKFFLESARTALALVAADFDLPIDIDCFYSAKGTVPARHDRLEGLKLIDTSAISVVHSSSAPLELDLNFLPMRVLLDTDLGPISFGFGLDLPGLGGF